MIFPKRLDATLGVDKAAQDEYRATILKGSTLLQNLVRALNSASSHNGNGVGVGEPIAKRPKIENRNGTVGDIYNILDPSFAKSGGVASSELSTGAILSRMTLGGLVNGLAGVEGGVVDTLTCISLNDLTNDKGGVFDEAAQKEERKKQLDATVASAGNLPLKELVQLGRGLHRSVSAR